MLEGVVVDCLNLRGWVLDGRFVLVALCGHRLLWELSLTYARHIVSMLCMIDKVYKYTSKKPVHY